MPRNVLLLGVTSFFADVASDMVVPLLPSFIVSLGGGAAFIGAVEGTAEAAASLLKFISGRWADKARRLLPLAVSGYAVAGAVRPLLAFAAAPWQVLALRCSDRVGKGLRTSPRDKLLAASAPPG
ncbi:MAG TPA: MFS transporter, partial [Myxococcales bacterium]|nr:MFS transporter [Myxococcales bacterium]